MHFNFFSTANVPKCYEYYFESCGGIRAPQWHLLYFVIRIYGNERKTKKETQQSGSCFLQKALFLLRFTRVQQSNRHLQFFAQVQNATISIFKGIKKYKIWCNHSSKKYFQTSLEKLISGRIDVHEEKVSHSHYAKYQTPNNDFRPMILFDAAPYFNFKGCLCLLWSSVLLVEAGSELTFNTIEYSNDNATLFRFI